MQFEHSPEEVERLIRQAFVDVPRPLGGDLAPHHCLECDEIRRLLEPHQFDSVPDETIDWLADSLPLLGPQGLHHYLPAYLLRALHALDYRGLDFLMFHLAPSEKDLAEGGEYWRQRLGMFTPEQRGAIRAFIEWFARSEEGPNYPEEVERARIVWE